MSVREWRCGKLRLLAAAGGGLVVGVTTGRGRESLILRGDFAVTFAAALIKSCYKTPSFKIPLKLELSSGRKSISGRYFCETGTAPAGTSHLLHVTPLPRVSVGEAKLVVGWNNGARMVQVILPASRLAGLVDFVENNFGDNGQAVA